MLSPMTYPFEHLKVFSLKTPVPDTSFQLAGGNIGTGEITILMLTQPTEHHVAADGGVMTSQVAGNNAKVTIVVQLTSALHHALLKLDKQLTVAANGGDVSNWAATVITLTFRNGSEVILSGVSFKDKGGKGSNVTWVLMACDAVKQKGDI